MCGQSNAGICSIPALKVKQKSRTGVKWHAAVHCYLVVVLY